MKMEPARLEPSCGPTEASVANSGFQRKPGKKSGRKIDWAVSGKQNHNKKDKCRMRLHEANT